MTLSEGLAFLINSEHPCVWELKHMVWGVGGPKKMPITGGRVC